MARSAVLDEIQSLDPRRDCQRIVFLSKCHDFGFDTARALEFALFRTYCVPSISALLDRTGEFRERPQKRYDDTEIIVNELLEYGYDSDRGRRALERMNRIHERFRIANSDFLYVLTTFIYEPIRWNARFGWRPMVANERLALFHFWREVGLRMNIREIPQDYDVLEQFNIEYERDRFRYHESNQRIGDLDGRALRRLVPQSARPPGATGDLRHARRSPHDRVRISSGQQGHAPPGPRRPANSGAAAAPAAAQESTPAPVGDGQAAFIPSRLPYRTRRAATVRRRARRDEPGARPGPLSPRNRVETPGQTAAREIPEDLA